jgi:uridylate kinase
MEHHRDEKHIVISLGGSLIVPLGVDTGFLRTFKQFIESRVSEGYTFALFIGGGAVCRMYNDALEALEGKATRDDKDWLGISVTKVNALFLKMIFGTLAYDEIIVDPNIIPTTDNPIVIGAGWKPGWSTDYDAVVYAKHVGASTVINLSNISHVYTKDPRKYPDAVKIEKITWAEFRTLIPETWEAGLHSPFDPIASRLAEESHISVSILDGNNIAELDNALLGKAFIGTQITP